MEEDGGGGRRGGDEEIINAWIGFFSFFRFFHSILPSISSSLHLFISPSLRLFISSSFHLSISPPLHLFISSLHPSISYFFIFLDFLNLNF